MSTDTSKMRTEFQYLYRLCSQNGYSSINIGSHEMQKECARKIIEFDNKYGVGRFENLKSWSGWLGSFIYK